MVVATIPDVILAEELYSESEIEQALSSLAYRQSLSIEPISALPFVIEEAPTISTDDKRERRTLHGKGNRQGAATAVGRRCLIGSPPAGPAERIQPTGIPSNQDCGEHPNNFGTTPTDELV